ncbi:MAG TPA: response regulator transcription factor, partial [Gemmatimonadaceae bacterium]|nr:response regulator transcription factor [Gemmatimonadaceae bacterium]
MTYSTLIDGHHFTAESLSATMARILIVEDNPDLAYGLRTGLEIEGYDVQIAEDGETGLERARAWKPDLVMLDLMLPGMDGYRVLKALRDGGSDVPVLILTARGEEADKVLGFRLGADDYVTKPCGVLELLARVGALLRRSRLTDQKGVTPDTVERFGSVEINPASRTV